MDGEYEYGNGVFGLTRGYVGGVALGRRGDCIAFRLEFTSSGWVQVALRYTGRTSVCQREMSKKPTRYQLETRICTG